MARGIIRCDECGAALGVSDKEIGKSGKCPRCGSGIEITREAFQRTETRGASEKSGGGGTAFAHRTVIMQLVDGFLEQLRFLGGRSRAFAAYQSLLIRLGLIGILVAGVVALVHMTVVSIRLDSMHSFLLGLGVAVVAVVLHYVASRFAEAGQLLLAENPCASAPEPVMDCLGFLSLLAGLGLVVYAVVEAVQASALFASLPPFVAAVALGHLALFFLNPSECLNSRGRLRGASAGETALSIAEMIYRCVLVLVPVLLALGVLGGASAMVVAMIMLWAGGGAAEEGLQMAQSGFQIALRVTGAAAAGPVVAYLVYLTLMLLRDLMFAVLQTARNTGRRR